jgi:hypothetical protein
MRHITSNTPGRDRPGGAGGAVLRRIRAGARWALLVTMLLSLTGATAAQARQHHNQRPKKHQAKKHQAKKHQAKKHHGTKGKSRAASRSCKKVKATRHRRSHIVCKPARRGPRPVKRGAPSAPATPPAPSQPGAPASPGAPTPPATPPATPAPAPGPAPLVSETFDGDGVFASSNAFWDNGDQGASQNPRWFAESGTINRRSGTGTISASTFRMWTRRTDLQNIRAEMDLKVDALPNLRGDTAGWDGVKFWLRRRLCTPEPACGRVHDPNSQAGYTAEVGLRDGRVYIQKKVGSQYTMLSSGPSNPIPYGSWMHVGGVVRNNPDGSVTIQVLRNGKVLVEVTDHGTGGAPLREPGRLGLRADNAQISVDNLTVTPIG